MRRQVVMWALAVLCLVVGVGLVFTWSAFAAMYVPRCPSFNVSASDPACRNPAIWVMVGYGVAGVGGLLLIVNVVRLFLGPGRRERTPTARS